jgi:MFS family permease
MESDVASVAPPEEPTVNQSEPIADLTEPPRGPVLRKSLSLVTVAWLFGAVWATTVSGAPVTQFARSMGMSEFQFGLLSASPYLASLISLPTSLWIERSGKRKRIFFLGNYLQRLLWIPIALIPFFMLSHYGMGAASSAVWMFLVMMFLMYALGNVGGPAWVSWMADIVPDRARGRYFSNRRMLGILTAVPATIFAGWLLDKLTNSGTASPLVMMQWCAVVFLAATFFGLADIALFHGVPEPHAEPKDESLTHIFSQPFKNRQFVWFAGYVAMLVLAVAPMGTFVTLFLVDRLGFSNKLTQIILLAVPMLGQLFMLPICGKAVDRMGKKPLMAIASLGLVPVGLAWCFVTREHAWLGAILAAAGAILWLGVEIANFNFVLEMTGDDNNAGGSSFIAVNSVIINAAGFVGGLLWGGIATFLRDVKIPFHFLSMTHLTYFEILFIVSAVLRLLAAVIFLPKMHEPEARPTREALRFMGANIYNNLFNLIFSPLRNLTIKIRETYLAREVE